MPVSKPLPSQEELNTLLYLDEDFEIYRRTGKNKGARAFDTPNVTGAGIYLVGSIKGDKYKTHRIIWKMYYGFDPDILDHIDGNTQNNHISNLRNGTQGKNMRNTKLPARNTSGIIGVTKSGSNKKPWRAQITVDKKRINLGDYHTKREAMEARKKAENLYGYSDNHGRGKNLFDLDLLPDYHPFEFNEKTMKRGASVLRAEVLRMPEIYLKTNSEKYKDLPVFRKITIDLESETL